MATRVDTTVKSRSNRANLDENYKNDNSPYSSISEAKNKIFRDNSIEEKHTGLTVLVKESGWTEAKEYWVQPLDTTPVTYGFVPKQTAEQVQADWNVSDSGSPAFIKNKPTIPSVPVISTDIASDAASDVKTASPKAVKNYVDSNKPSIQDSEQGSTAVTLDGAIHVSAIDAEPNENAGVEITPRTGGGVDMKFTLPKGADGITPSIDSTTKQWMIGTTPTGVLAEGHNPNRGTYNVGDTFPSDGITGDYIVVVDDSQATTTAEIHKWDATLNSNAGGWVATGVAPSDAAFDGGQLVTNTKIVNNLNTGGAGNVLSAEAGKKLNEKLYSHYDDEEESDTDYSGNLSSENDHFKSGSFELDGNGKYYWKGASPGYGRTNYITNDELTEIKETYCKLRVIGGPTSTYDAALVMFSKKALPANTNLTFQQLVDGGYICDGFTEDTYITEVPTANNLPEGKVLVIPNGAKYFYAVRKSIAGKKRNPSSVIPFSTSVDGDVDILKKDVNDLKNDRIHDGDVTTAKIADGAVTKEKIADGAVNDILINAVRHITSYNLLNINEIKAGYGIKGTDGSEATTSTSNIGASPYIPVEAGKKYYLFGGGYATIGGTNYYGAVYDANKNFIASVKLNSSSTLFEPDNGVAFLRHAIDMTATVQALLPALEDDSAPSIAGVTNKSGNIQLPYFEKRQEFIDPNLLIGVENAPFVKPALSITGGHRAVVTNQTLSANTPLSLASLSTNPYPQYIKGCHTISFKGFIANALGNNDSVRIGVNRRSTNGKTINISGSTISVDYYNSRDSLYINCFSPIEHGLTIDGFIIIEMSLYWNGGKVRLACKNGCFVHEWTIDDYNSNAKLYARESQGIASMIANVDMTNVELSQTSDRFMKPIWFFGDSYTSVYEYGQYGRWPFSMIYTYGVEGFMLDGYPGAESEDIYPDLVKALEYGTPKYLVWCLGLNDASSSEVKYFNYAKQVEMLCKERGITLIYEKLPYRWDQNSAFRGRLGKINNYIENSGYRYIDFFAAVSADSEGNWYTGMLDSGNAHPTPLGAKILAGQILTDFPEIANYK